MLPTLHEILPPFQNRPQNTDMTKPQQHQQVSTIKSDKLTNQDICRIVLKGKTECFALRYSHGVALALAKFAATTAINVLSNCR